jgi:hypothetical protein
MRRSSRIAAKANAAAVAPPVKKEPVPEVAPSAPKIKKEQASRPIKREAPSPSPAPASSKETTSKESTPSISSESSDSDEYSPEYESPEKIRKAPRRRPPKKAVEAALAAAVAAATAGPAPARPQPAIQPSAQYDDTYVTQINYEMEALAEEGTVNLNSRITVTRAKAEYQLNANDIAHLSFQTRKNPHHPDAAPMRLFSLREIIKTAYLKHGGAAGLQAALDRSAARKERLRQGREAREEDG